MRVVEWGLIALLSGSCLVSAYTANYWRHEAVRARDRYVRSVEIVRAYQTSVEQRIAVLEEIRDLCEKELGI